MPNATHDRATLVLALVLAAGCATSLNGRSTDDPVAGERIAGAPAGPLLGAAVNAHHISDLPLYLESVDAIAELGANALVLVTPMFQERVDASQIRFLPERCPTDDQLVAILRRAEARGLHTTLLPIVLIEHPGPADWRGKIAPADPEAWWASYGRLTDRFLAVARAGGADAYSIGSELNSMESQVERWAPLVARAREALACPITYTANWDRYEMAGLWDLLDFVSVSAYFELAPPDDPAACRRALARAWAGERDRLLAFCRRQERRLVLLELGYPSLPWAAAHPWNYTADPGTAADHDAQARCYRAFFDAWSAELARPDTPVAGVHCYAWDPYNHGGPHDTGYGFRGKPAMEVIRSAFAGIRRAAER